MLSMYLFANHPEKLTLAYQTKIDPISKDLKTRYTLMDCYFVDLHWLSEIFGTSMLNQQIAPHLLTCLGKCGEFQTDK